MSRPSSAFDGEDEDRGSKRQKSSRTSGHTSRSSSRLPTTSAPRGSYSFFRSGNIASSRAGTPINSVQDHIQHEVNLPPSTSYGSRDNPISLEDDDVVITAFQTSPRGHVSRIGRGSSAARADTPIKQERGQSELRRRITPSYAPRSSVRRSTHGSIDFPHSLDDSDNDETHQRSDRRSVSRSGGSFLPRLFTPNYTNRNKSGRQQSTPLSSHTSRSSTEPRSSQTSRSSQGSRASSSQHYDVFGSMPPPPPLPRFKHEDLDEDEPSNDDLIPPILQPYSSEEPIPELSDEQQLVYDEMQLGHNIFYTGSAGSGKSTLLKAARISLRSMGKRVQVVAPTGKAALDIAGVTTWHFAGWSQFSFKESIAELKVKVLKPGIRQRMRDVDVLIIDEISMVENWFLERLNIVMKVARDDERPFGGVQLIVTGDFCQLPPIQPFYYCLKCGWVTDRTVAAQYTCDRHGTFYDADKWAFASKAWEEAEFRCFHLETIHRQKDPQLQTMLQKIRLGKEPTEEERKLLLYHACDVEGAIQLFCRKDDVAEFNATEYRKIKAKKVTYFCEDFWKWNRNHEMLELKGRQSVNGDTLTALEDHRFESVLKLKTGMRVVLLSNLDIDKGLVNGSTGVIVGFVAHGLDPLPKPKNIQDESTSLDENDKRERIVDETAQTLGGSHATLQLEEIKRFMGLNNQRCWPKVRFDNGLVRAITANCSVVELGDEKPYSLLARTQIPLAAAYALTVHKAQGMTLDKVIVDLSKTWECGQEYVALSRARALEGLKVERLSRGGFRGCDPQVKQFLKDTFNIE